MFRADIKPNFTLLLWPSICMLIPTLQQPQQSGSLPLSSAGLPSPLPRVLRPQDATADASSLAVPSSQSSPPPPRARPVSFPRHISACIAQNPTPQIQICIRLQIRLCRDTAVVAAAAHLAWVGKRGEGERIQLSQWRGSEGTRGEAGVWGTAESEQDGGRYSLEGLGSRL